MPWFRFWFEFFRSVPGPDPRLFLHGLLSKPTETPHVQQSLLDLLVSPVTLQLPAAKTPSHEAVPASG